LNFLAHFLLSGSDEEVIFGNFLGDFLKGNEIKDLSGSAAMGLELHRFIDRFTDQHPQVRNSVNTVKSEFGRYSGVVIDVYYDHILAKEWTEYQKANLRFFADSMYQVLTDRVDLMPGRALRFYHYMLTNDILYNYQFIEGISLVFQGMSRRASFNSRMELAPELLVQYLEVIENDFRIFFPELVLECKEFIKTVR
jgi:acyl carrier protein phosphodiesterase